MHGHKARYARTFIYSYYQADIFQLSRLMFVRQLLDNIEHLTKMRCLWLSLLFFKNIKYHLVSIIKDINSYGQLGYICPVWKAITFVCYHCFRQTEMPRALSQENIYLITYGKESSYIIQRLMVALIFLCLTTKRALVLLPTTSEGLSARVVLSLQFAFSRWWDINKIQ